MKISLILVPDVLPPTVTLIGNILRYATPVKKKLLAGKIDFV